MKRLKSYITFFILLVFVSTKLASAHVLFHDDEKTDTCELCKVVLVHNDTPTLLLVADFEFPFVCKITSNITSILKGVSLTKKLLSNQIKSRPPPLT